MRGSFLTGAALLVAAGVGMGLVGTTGAARATVMQYQFDCTATGTIGSSTFTNAATTIVLTSDTTTLANNGAAWHNPSTAASITIAGIGTASISTPIEFTYSPTFGIFGAYQIGTNSLVKSANGQGALLAGWNFISNFGPVTAPTDLIPGNYSTTLGTVRINAAPSLTLTATVLPAPGAAALLGMGGLLAARRRRS